MNSVARKPSAGFGMLARSMPGADSVMVAPFRLRPTIMYAACHSCQFAPAPADRPLAARVSTKPRPCAAMSLPTAQTEEGLVTDNVVHGRDATTVRVDPAWDWGVWEGWGVSLAW